MTNARPLIAALILATAALSFIGVGAYKKYHKPHVPAPIAVTPIAAPVPLPTPKPVIAEKDHDTKAHAAKKHRAKVKAKVKVKKTAPAYVEAKAKVKKLHTVAARLKEDAAGGRKVTCEDVKWYVATYPKFVLDQFAKLATEEQKERGKKCLGY